MINKLLSPSCIICQYHSKLIANNEATSSFSNEYSNETENKIGIGNQTAAKEESC